MEDVKNNEHIAKLCLIAERNGAFMERKRVLSIVAEFHKDNYQTRFNLQPYIMSTIERILVKLDSRISEVEV